MRLAVLISGLCLVGLTACTPPAVETSADFPEAVLEVTGAYIVKPGPGRDIAGGGLILNVTGEPMWLTGATSEMADTVELHTMSMEDGVMRMRKVERMEVAENAPLILEKGGNHLMFFGVSPDIVAGETADIVLTLTDEDGEQQTLIVEAEIRELGE